ncbi:MAG: glycosyltransferase [Acidimicrobiales bacterium]
MTSLESSVSATAPARGARRELAAARGDAATVVAPESRARLRAVHLSALLALAVSVAYLVWRVGWTLGTWWIAVPLWLLEAHAVLGLGLYTFSLWNLDSVTPTAPVATIDQRVAVLITTYDEPREVLLPTIAAAVALAPAHETWVLDDGGREWVRELARTLGARYRARTTHEGAKAGNLNDALAHVGADLIAVLDADHIAGPDFLTHTLGYFADPRVALVQTPQDFYNLDSFENDRNRSWLWRDRRVIPFNEQRLFYRAIQPGKNRWGAAFWCGTNAVLRVSALREVGGVATETLTEDIHTSLRLHRRGWRSVYHNEVMARGLAARDADQYQAQRLRWGTGAMQLLRVDHPLTAPGLRPAQRVAYASTILGWFDAWRSLGYVLIPLAVLVTGAVPIRAPLELFALAFALTFVVQRFALAQLSRGYAPQGLAAVFELVRMQAIITATLYHVRPGTRQFTVTPKAGATARRRTTAPWLLWTLLGGTVAALVVYVLTRAGMSPVTYAVPWTADGAALWALVNGGLLVAALARIRSERFATDRRSAVRVRVRGRVRLDECAGELVDVSVGGALVRCATPPPRGPHVLVVAVAGEGETRIRAQERSRQSVGDGGVLVSLRFDADQSREVGSVAAALVGGRLGHVRQPVGSRSP